MSFVDVEAEEDGSVHSQHATEEDGSASDADTSLSGFICDDGSVSDEAAESGEITAPVVEVSDDWSETETYADAARLKPVAKPADSPSSLFAEDSASSSDEEDDDPEDDALMSDECEGPDAIFGASDGSERPSDERREVLIDGAVVPLPHHACPISLVLQDGLVAELEAEPYEIWKQASARPRSHPCFQPGAETPADWFDDLHICKDSRGSYCVRSVRTVIATSSKIQFPSGKTLEVPVKKIVVEHALFPYDEKTWANPANYRPPVVLPLESSDEDLIEAPAAAAPPAPAEPPSKRSSRTESERLSRALRKELRKQKRAEVDTRPGYIISDEDAKPSPKHAPFGATDILEKPELKVKAHLATIKTTKQKQRRQRRLELMRLKRDLTEEKGGGLQELWPLSERRTKRQERVEQALRKTAAHARAAARQLGAEYNFLLPE